MKTATLASHASHLANLELVRNLKLVIWAQEILFC